MSSPEKSLAVALEYETGQREAPRVTAKGRGAVAEKIIAIAQEHGVVIDSNPLLAQALSGVELEEEIPVELYQAVAEVIGFVMRKSAQRK